MIYNLDTILDEDENVFYDSRLQDILFINIQIKPSLMKQNLIYWVHIWKIEWKSQ